jgi:hypothetical protein
MKLDRRQKEARGILAETLHRQDPGAGYPAAITKATGMIREAAGLTAAQVLRPVPALTQRPADPVMPLHQMNSDEMADLGDSWFATEARSGHPSPFWRIAS